MEYSPSFSNSLDVKEGDQLGISNENIHLCDTTPILTSNSHPNENEQYAIASSLNNNMTSEAPLSEEKSFLLPPSYNFTTHELDHIDSSSAQNPEANHNQFPISSYLVEFDPLSTSLHTSPPQIPLNTTTNCQEIENNLNNNSLNHFKDIEYSNISKEIDQKLASIKDLNNFSFSIPQHRDTLFYFVKDQNGVRQKFKALITFGGRVIQYENFTFSTVNDWLNFIKTGVLNSSNSRDKNNPTRNFFQGVTPYEIVDTHNDLFLFSNTNMLDLDASDIFNNLNQDQDSLSMSTSSTDDFSQDVNQIFSSHNWVDHESMTDNFNDPVSAIQFDNEKIDEINSPDFSLQNHDFT